MNPSESGRTIIVNQAHFAAHDSNQGSPDKPLRTIQAAADLAFPGDSILVHAGIYRETIVPPRGGEPGRPITYQAAPGERVTVKGSDSYQGDWHPEAAQGLYTATLTLPEDVENPFAIRLVEKGQKYIDQMGNAATRRTLGQVFMDGQPLDEVDRMEHLERMPGTWMSIEDGKKVLVHFPVWVVNPADHLVELTVRKAVFRPEIRGLGYLTIRGFLLEHAANQALTSFWEKGFAPQQGLVSCRSGHHWVIEDNAIRFAKSVGLDVGSEGRMDELDGQPTLGLVGYHHIAGNTISDNGQCGICGLGHIGTQIIGNVLERNNTLGAVAWEEAAIKTHFYLNGRIEGNLIRGNHCNGIWLDNVYQNIHVSRNVILDNQGAGIFVEMGGGPCLIDNNIIALQSMGNDGIGGNGIYAHDASGITVVHNFLAENAGFGVLMKNAVDRSYSVYSEDTTSFEEQPLGEQPCHCRNQNIQNNIFVKNGRGAVNLPYPGEKAGDSVCDHNLYCDWGEGGIYGVNSTGGTGLEQIFAAFYQTRERNGRTGPAQHLVTGDDLLLTRQDWQELMDMDRESASAEINNVHWQILHVGPGPWLTFHLAKGEIICPAFPGVDRDFNGNPLPPDTPAPGPFQSVKAGGAFHFRLWPLQNHDGTMKI